MASTSTQEESSTSSSSLPPRPYDVFLSFRGEDTRKNFTDHLFTALKHHGFYTFRDNKLKRGEEIGPELLKTIEGSRSSVIVFSRNYATSRWCLDELVKILECKSTFKQIVVPVFYHVDPSDVRAQRGSFAEAFSRHEERYKGGEMECKVKGWRDALTQAANLSGWDLQNVADGYESKFIEKIVKDISNKLNLPYLNVVEYPVNIEPRVQQVNKLLRLESKDVHMVGIFGIGGIGKTTIAKATYNLICLKFEGRSFLANVREISKQPNGLVILQKMLISNILMNEPPDITNVDYGIELIKQRLWCRRVLLVLDDVDEHDQIRALAIRRDWLHSGSRIIVTTRDESLLKLLKVNEVYMPRLLNRDNSLELFSWHAFGKDHPKEDYVELSREVVGYARGLPLALEVLGSFLFDKTLLEWKSALEKLKVIPHEAIQEKLRISYDSLSVEQKDLFLDIAFFFVGMDKNYTIKILEGCGSFPEIEIGVLSRRCLVSIDESNQLMMHDMLRDMGREIVRREYPKKPGKRSRLWFHEDVLDVLTNHTGTKAVEGLVLNLPSSYDVQSLAFAKMNRLRLLKLNYVHVSGSYEHLSKGLRWLCWFGFPLKSIPSNLFMENLVAIDMCYSSLEQVWKERKTLNKLKFLNLSHSHCLIETPDFLGCTNLEKLFLNDCIRLVEVHQSIECLDKLVVLDMRHCKNLWKLPPGIWKLTSLQNLELSGCSKLEKLPRFEGSPSESQSSLFSSCAALVRNPDSISHSPATIPGLISLRRLNLANCNFSYVPNELGSLITLNELDLMGNNICTLPDSISHLSRLWRINLSHCTRLQSLPKLPVNLSNVVARHCTSLERLTIGSNFRLYPELIFSCCHKLDQNNIASYFTKCILQNKELGGGFLTGGGGASGIIFPGSEVPDYFSYQRVGSVLSFVVSLLPDQKIQGWTLCIVIGGRKDGLVDDDFGVTAISRPFSYKFKNKTKGIEMVPYRASFNDLVLYHQDHVWLYHIPKVYPELQMDDRDEIEFSVSRNDWDDSILEFQVKKCGVKLIYKDGEKDYQSNDQAVVVRHSYGRESVTKPTSPTATTGTSGKTKHDDGDKSGSCNWKNPNALPFFNNDQAMIQYASPSFQDVILDEDVSADQTDMPPLCMRMSFLINMFQQIKQSCLSFVSGCHSS